MAKERSVKAQVRLLFRTVTPTGDENLKMIIRSMEATQTLKSITVKSIDSTISSKDSEGHTKDVSSKCIDVNMEILNLMGVSRPIINYVIFCHQEDSNWPLEEGSKVKEKFDEIFNSAKYQKCLKNIKDVRKEQMEKEKKEQLHMNHYKSDKEMAERKQVELFSKKSELEQIKGTVDKISADLEPILDDLKEVEKEEEGFGEIQKKLQEAKTSCDHVKDERRSLEKQITEILPQSMDDVEIEEKRNGVEKETKTKEADIRGLEEEIEGLERNLFKREKSLQKNAAEIGKSLEGANQNKKNIEEKYKEIQRAAEEFDLVEEEDFLSVLEKEEKRVANQSHVLKKQNDVKERDINEEIDSLKSKKTGLEERKKREQADLIGFKKEIAVIKRQLNDLEGAAEKLEKIKKDWEKAGRRLEEEKNKFDLKSLSDEIDQEREAIKDLEREEHKVREERKSLEEIQSTLQQIKHIDEDLQTKQEKIKKLMNKRQNEFLQLFESVPDTKRVKVLWKNSEESTTKKLEEIKNERAKLEAEKSSKKKAKIELKRSLDQKNSKKQVLESKISEVLGPTDDLDEELEKVKESLEMNRKELSVKEAGKFTYREMIDKMKKMDCAACPTCNRAFNKKDEAKELIEDLEDEIMRIPAKVKNLELNVKKFQAKLEQLQRIRPEAHELKNLVKDIEENTKKLSTLESEMKTLESRLEDGEEDWSITEVTASLIKTVSDDVQIIDSLTKELSSLSEKKEELDLAVVGGKGRDVKEVRQEEEMIQEKIKVARKNLDQCQETVSNQTSLINELESMKNKLTEKKLDIEGQQQQRSNMMDKKEEMEVKVTRANDALRKCDQDLEPIREELEEAEERKRKCVKEAAGEIQKLQLKERKIERFKDNLIKLEKSIQQYKDEGKAEELTQLKQTKNNLETEIQTVKDEKKDFDEKISKLKIDISNQESRRRMYDDNIKLRKYVENESKYQRIMDKYEKQLKESNWETVAKKKDELVKQYSLLTAEKNAKEGQIAEVTKSIREKERELNDPKLKNAAKMFKEMKIKAGLRKKVSEDLDKYYRALDFAIMKFHKEKMKVVNKIIRELWKATYRGNDIDYIEIKANEDGEQSKGADMKKTYNYRVVMVKNMTELDMRGRCSAGQKVLSSLIIRLALAETFSSNCGIIALDEPTTNLDRENIESLAEALGEIVEKRAVQSNFQLVIITHDEDFIEQLARNKTIESYQKVSRNARGLSVIRKLRTN